MALADRGAVRLHTSKYPLERFQDAIDDLKRVEPAGDSHAVNPRGGDGFRGIRIVRAVPNSRGIPLGEARTRLPTTE
ncbi:hypothetical protein GCM10009854_35470 [Saccharopolyspora halophila]|uniref:Uncharacterized protein n=2 Tax=Saccharopolyspora halophila TaxID=405551 RepID=A0ABN3GKP5_9PSEU